MNILSISQAQTQNAQSDFNQMLSAQTQKTSDGEKSSFADYLRDARRTSENTETAKTDNYIEENSSAETEKVAKNDENIDSSKISEKKEEKTDDKNGKSEKVAQKKTSEDKNGEEISKSVKSNEIENIAVQNPNFAKAYNIQTVSDENVAEVVAVDAEAALSSDNIEIDEKMLSWLMSSGRIEEKGDEISNEDFMAMIDAAVEFIPGEETEEEKLLSAQNLAVKDPALFLQSVENNVENVAKTAVKTEISLDDKKIVASKEKKNDTKITVHDLRTRHLFDEEPAKVASDKIVQKSAEKKEINLSMQKQADGNVQMTMELAAKAEQNITSSSAQSAGANGSNFQAMLSNAVQENAPDFVKAGNIVLKDNKQGSINLILRPEGLGNVKISLNLDDKNLSAQIVVHTKEAMEAFKESIPSLKQAFTESGFETGSFDLNFSNNQSNQQGFAQGENQNQQLFAQKSYGEFVTPGALAQEGSADSSMEGSYAINIVA